jgi:rubrerythrin
MMSEDKTVEILKNAILLEKRGHAFYHQVANQTSGKAVKQFFEFMAEEEIKHIKILSDQFKAYQDNNKFDPGDFNDDHGADVASNVLTVKQRQFLRPCPWKKGPFSSTPAVPKKPRIPMKKPYIAGWPNGKCSILNSSPT